MKQSRFDLLKVFMMLVLALNLYGCSSTSDNDSSKSNSSSQEQTTESQQTNEATESADKTNLKTFTLEELKKYDGQNGNPAYVAVNGTVYDVSNDRKWQNGKHEEYKAGTDLTADMKNAPHDNKVLDSLPVIGKLAE